MIDYNNLPNCPVQTCLNFISDKWKILIIRDLMESTKRFNELKKIISAYYSKNAYAAVKRNGSGWFSSSGGLSCSSS